MAQDLFTEEEQRKREQRAARFGLPAGSGLEWKPPQVGGGCWRQAAGLPGLNAAWQHVRMQQASTELLSAAQADEDQEKRRARAERFGVEYRPKDETGLMDVGEDALLLLLRS